MNTSLAASIIAFFIGSLLLAGAADLAPVVEIEEDHLRVPGQRRQCAA